MKLDAVSNATKVYALSGNFGLDVGQVLKLEAGDDELDEVVPAGKHWGVRVYIRVEEVDA